jgi:PAS domain S-box-containing protein
MRYKFSDLIEAANVQRLNDLFCTATGIPAAVIDLEGTIVTSSGWQEICTKFHRMNEETAQRCAESDTVFANRIGVGQKYTVYKCENGLVVGASPIAIGGEHVSNFITSQFLFHPPDRDFFLEQAKRFGFDEIAYMEAVGKIPAVDESKLQPVLEYFSELAAMLGEMGLRQLKQLEAAAALRESEQRWATTLLSIGDAVIATGNDGRITFMNAVAEGLTGWTLTEAAAKPVTEVFRIINELTREAVDNPVTNVLEKGMIVGLANHTVLLSRDGSEIPIDDSGAPIRDEGGSAMGVVLVFRDITDRKLQEKRIARVTQLYVILSRVNEAIVRTRDQGLLYEEVCRIIAKEGAFPLVWIGEVKDRQVVPMAHSGPGADYLKEIRVEVDGPLGRGLGGTSIREDRPVVNDDFDTNPATLPWREVARRHGLRASASFPLHCQGKVIGGLTLYGTRPQDFDAEQVELLQALAADVSYALDAFDQEKIRSQAEAALEKEQRAREEQRAWELERLGELERFRKLTVGRELKMIELKNEIEDLRKENGLLRKKFPSENMES